MDAQTASITMLLHNRNLLFDTIKYNLSVLKMDQDFNYENFSYASYDIVASLAFPKIWLVWSEGSTVVLFLQ